MDVEKKQKKVLKTKFKELREKYYSSINPKDKRLLKQDDLAKHLNTTRDVIVRTENEKVSGYDPDLLKGYSDFFGVSIEYLLGFDDIPSKDLDVKDICQKTGLNEKTVNALIEDMNLGKDNPFDAMFRENYAAVINDLIEYNDKKKVALFNYIYSFLHFDYMDVAESDLFWNDSDNRPDQMMKSLATVRLVDRNGVSCVVGLDNAFHFTTQYIMDKLNAIRLHIRVKKYPENSFEYHWNYEKKTRKQKGETK